MTASGRRSGTGAPRERQPRGDPERRADRNQGGFIVHPHLHAPYAVGLTQLGVNDPNTGKYVAASEKLSPPGSNLSPCTAV
jgi:hypothetical protein